ncbi:MAG: glycosyltransferase family 2 protein [Muribaculaceae bacterium]|nr:glycosyltransferase family 2 protein [Muribaculaceae bacterium]
MTVALIISTYNRPDALDVVLRSVTKQTMLPDEIIIADDGSGEKTQQLIRKWQQSPLLPVPLKHIWQIDEGFRLAMIRNKAIAASNCEYIIQIDGDAFIHPKFIEDHLKMAKKGFFVKGSRILLDKSLSDKICESKKYLFPSVFSLHIERYREKAFRCGLLRDFFVSFNPKDLSALGCNMAFWRDDAIRVNGYDEEFTGWGHEDTDFTMRLHRNGIEKRNIRYAALIYHLWHKQAGDGIKNAILRDNQSKLGNIKALKGINQYL